MELTAFYLGNVGLELPFGLGADLSAGADVEENLVVEPKRGEDLMNLCRRQS